MEVRDLWEKVFADLKRIREKQTGGEVMDNRCPDCGGMVDPIDGLCDACTLKFMEEDGQAFSEKMRQVIGKATSALQVPDDVAELLKMLTPRARKALSFADLNVIRGFYEGYYRSRFVGEWTTEPPTEPGPYWWRGNPDAPRESWYIVDVCHLKHRDQGRYLWFKVPVLGAYTRANYGEWCPVQAAP